MKTLRNYVLKEFIGPLFLGIGVLTLVMLLGNLVKIATLVITKGVQILSVIKLFLFMMPYLLTFTVPIAALVATLFALGRLSSDNEIVAIRTSGINIIRLITPLLVVGLILSLILVIFNDRVIPYAHFATRKTLMDIGIKNPTAALEPGVFINSFDKYILFVYRIDDNKLTNIRIYEPLEGKATRTIVAKHGEFIALPEKKAIKLKLMDGTSDEPDPRNPTSLYKLNFKTYFMTLNLNAMQQNSEINKKPKDMTIRELKHEVASFTLQGIDPAPQIIEINRRIALAFSVLVFILLGSSLAIITRRREKSVNIGIAILVVGAYYLLSLGFEALSQQGFAHPGIAIWAPNIILGLLGTFLVFRLCAS